MFMCAKWFLCDSNYTVSCTVVLLRVNCGLSVLKSVTEVMVLIMVHPKRCYKRCMWFMDYT